MTSHPSSNRTWLMPYAVLFGILVCVTALTLWQAYHRSVFVDESSRISSRSDDQATPRLARRVNPNTAEWYELSQLPGLGKTAAQQIISLRRARQLEWQQAQPGRSLEDAPPAFVTPEDLLPVKGIGPKTLEKIRPYLELPEDAAGATQPAMR